MPDNSAPSPVCPPSITEPSSSNSRPKIPQVALALILAITILGIICINLPGTQTAPTQQEVQSDGLQWTSLMGNNLDAWDSWLGMPHLKNGRQRTPEDFKTNPGRRYRLNNDPENVFSLINMNGKETIKISGRVCGGLTTKADFQDYHLFLRYHWGEKAWPFFQHQPSFDSGITVHTFGSFGDIYDYWLPGVEFQLQEEGSGDILFHQTRARVPFLKDAENDWEKRTYHPDHPGVFTSKTISRGNGITTVPGWNTAEIYAKGTTLVFLLNGEICMVTKNLSKSERHGFAPLRNGKIQLQSRASEIYFPDHIQGLTDTITP